MPLEKSAGAVIFRKENNNIYYLLLHYGLGHWGFVKGHIEKGESLKDTVLRETEEETGIKDIKFIDGFKAWTKYFFNLKGKKIFKIVTYFLAETKTKKIKLSFEHTDFKWLSYSQAIKTLTFKNSKDILKKANNFLIKKQKEKRSLNFKEKVYKVVRSIKAGRTMTYKEVAEKAGRPKAWRAVGNILNKNKDPHIPCHRVIRSDGKAGGYNKGIKEKIEILKSEGVYLKK